jgi:hypothetical protein
LRFLQKFWKNWKNQKKYENFRFLDKKMNKSEKNIFS